MIVSDSGPIIAFSRIGRLDILHELFSRVIIPDAVHDELIMKGQGRQGAIEISQSLWIQHRTVANQAYLERLARTIHAGEREAIAIAREMNAQLLIDELRKKVARCQDSPF